MNFLKSVSVGVLLSALTTLGTQAQQQPGGMPPSQQQQSMEVSDAELESFAGAYQAAQSIEQEAQKEMIDVIEGEDMTVQRFNEITQERQSGDIDLAADESKTYRTASERINEIQQSTQQKVMDKIEEEGLTSQKYQQIAQAVQADPKLRAKLQELIQG